MLTQERQITLPSTDPKLSHAQGHPYYWALNKQRPTVWYYPVICPSTRLHVDRQNVPLPASSIFIELIRLTVSMSDSVEQKNLWNCSNVISGLPYSEAALFSWLHKWTTCVCASVQRDFRNRLDFQSPHVIRICTFFVQILNLKAPADIIIVSTLFVCLPFLGNHISLGESFQNVLTTCVTPKWNEVSDTNNVLHQLHLQ